MLIKILLQWQPKLPLFNESHSIFLDSFVNEDYLRKNIYNEDGEYYNFISIIYYET